MLVKTSQRAPYSSRPPAAVASPLPPPSLLERIRALDRSAELSHRYTPLVLFHPDPSLSEDGRDGSVSVVDPSSYAAVGHAETSFITSTLIHCRNGNGNPIFVTERLRNELGVTTRVLRLHVDVQAQNEGVDRSKDGAIRNGGGYDRMELFRARTEAFECVTDHLLSSGVISRKHSDVYPVSPFTKPSGGGGGSGDDGGGATLAHVNRSAAPYLGIDSVGVHLHCYVCERDVGEDGGRSPDAEGPPIKGLWLARRAPTKSHHPNDWDPTAAGGQPAGLSLVENVAKEAQEEAGVPAAWIRNECSAAFFSDHTNDPLTITTAKPDGTCLKRSLYYSCDLRVPPDWTPVPVDGEVSEFRLYSMEELEEELRYGDSVRPAMRAVFLDFMIRHATLKGQEDLDELRGAMRRERFTLW